MAPTATGSFPETALSIVYGYMAHVSASSPHPYPCGRAISSVSILIIGAKVKKRKQPRKPFVLKYLKTNVLSLYNQNTHHKAFRGIHHHH